MMVLLWLGGWLAAGLVSLALSVRLIPTWWMDRPARYSNWGHPMGPDPTAPMEWDTDMLPNAIGMVLLWPLGLMLVVTWIVWRGSVQSVIAKESLRRELEKELKAARAEVDELLNRKPGVG